MEQQTVRPLSVRPPETEVEDDQLVPSAPHPRPYQLILPYLLQAPAKRAPGSQLRFSGEITLNQGDQTKTVTTGKTTMTIAPYHRADLDQDNAMDDEEILAVCDRYSSIRPNLPRYRAKSVTWAPAASW